MGHRPISDDEISRSATYLPHVAKALEIARPFKVVQTLYHAVLNALDKLLLGVVIVQDDGRIVLANAEARRIIDERPSVYTDPTGRLRFDPDIESEIKHSIKRAIATVRAEDEHLGSWYLVSDQSEDVGIIVDVFPLRDPNDEIERNLRAAAVILTDSDNRPALSETTMDTVFSLSGAEAEVIALILDGLSTEDIADTRGTTLATAQTQIKSVMRKTSSRTRVDLVRLATKMNPPVKRPASSD